MKNLIKAPLEGLVYPFANVGSLLLPFLMALVVYGGLIYVLFEMDVFALAEGRFGSISNILMNIVLILAVVIAVMPLLVNVARNVVLGDKIDPLVITRFYHGRELSVVWGFIKLLVAMYIPILIAIGLIAVIEGVEFMRLQGQMLTMSAQEAAAISWMGTILFSLGVLGMFIVMARGSMVFITGALDRGVSIRNSFAVTKHHTFVVLLTVVLVVLLITALLSLAVFIAGKLGFVIGVEDLLTLSHGGKLTLTVIVAFVRLLVAVIFIAAFAKLYVRLTAKK